MKIKKLEWKIISNIGGGYYADVNSFGTGYAIWFQDGKTITGDPSNNHISHASKEDAMEWCQQDFEKRVKLLIE